MRKNKNNGEFNGWEHCLNLAKEKIKSADHIAYVSLSILGDNRMLIKIMELISQAVKELIKAFLYYEHDLQRVNLYKDRQRNLKTFIEKIAPRYLDNSEKENLIRILRIGQKHKDAAVEFVRQDKFVILLGDKYEVLDIKIVRDYLQTVKSVLVKFPITKKE